MTRLAYVNIFARDIEKLSNFYAELFGFAEVVAHRSPIYRCLDAGGIELGFNAGLAYELLGVAERESAEASPRVYPTFEVGSEGEVADIARKAVRSGGRIAKPPYDTYYNARQCVLEDPEGNLLRLNHRKGPRAPADQVENPPWRR